MAPSVLFREVDDFLGLGHPVHEWYAKVLGVFGPNEGLGDLVDDVAVLAAQNVELDHAQSLVSTIDLQVMKLPAVGRPAEAGPPEVDQSDLGFFLKFCGKVEPVQFEGRERITWQGILAGMKLGRASSLGGRFNEVDLAYLARFHAKRDQVV